SRFSFFFSSRRRHTRSKRDWSSDVCSSDLPVHRWFPASGSGPGALVLQEIFGVSTYIRHRAADLAKAGYVVYVPELYHRITDEPVGEEDLERGMELAGQLPWSEALADARAALDALRTADAVTGGVAIVGFC